MDSTDEKTGNRARSLSGERSGLPTQTGGHREEPKKFDSKWISCRTADQNLVVNDSRFLISDLFIFLQNMISFFSGSGMPPRNFNTL